MKTFRAGTYKKQYQYKSSLPSVLAPFEWQSELVVKLLNEATKELSALKFQIVPN